MAYPIQKFRMLFEIATDVKDNKIEKAFFEADLLDILPQVGAMYDAIPDEYIADGAGLRRCGKGYKLLCLCPLLADCRPEQYNHRDENSDVRRFSSCSRHE